jgi:hypothetical protein
MNAKTSHHTHNMDEHIEKHECPIFTMVDSHFSRVLVFITTMLLGFAYYLTYLKWEMFPAIYVTAMLFGFSCMGIVGLQKLEYRYDQK